MNRPAIINSAMDDAQLTPQQFRVLAHICRRAGSEDGGRGCDASTDSMARTCRIHADTVRDSLKVLVASGWLVAQERRGNTTVYRPRIGNPPETKGGVGNEGRGRKPREGTPPKRREGTPRKRMESKETLKETLKESHKSETLFSILPFDSVEFSEAWEKWRQFRKEKRNPLTETATTEQLRDLAKAGEAASIEAIYKSIKSGWTGLFPANGNQSTKPTRAPIAMGGRVATVETI